MSIDTGVTELLPHDCREAIELGVAVIRIKFGSLCVIDTQEASLFDVLPIIHTKFGFAISIPYRKGYLNTFFAEVISRKRGKVTYLNGCSFDLRLENIEIEEWVDYHNNKSQLDSGYDNKEYKPKAKPRNVLKITKRNYY